MVNLDLDKNEISLLKNLALTITAVPSQDPDMFCKQVKAAALMAPPRIRNILLAFSKHGSESGFLLIKLGESFIKPQIKTPPNNTFLVGEKTEIAKVQAILMSVMGEMVAYEAEGFGYLFQDIVPNIAMAKEQVSLGSNVELEVHTEQAFSNLRPDIISLACIRGDAEANTHILPIRKILDNITKEERQFLLEPLWLTSVDMSFKINGHSFIEGDVRGPLSILNGSEEDHVLIFDQDLMQGVNENANTLLKKICNIYYDHKLKHNLKSGEIMFVDNKRALHGRSPFYPNYDGSDRFLVRCFAVFDYERTRYARENNRRTILAKFS